MQNVGEMCKMYAIVGRAIFVGFRNITVFGLSVAELERMKERKMGLYFKKVGCRIKHFGKM
jgi:hypothetical protein